MAKHALVVGVNYSGHELLNELEFAVKDATEINNFLIKSGYENPIFLPGSEATQTRIVGELQAVCSKLKEGDTFFFYFSGHGFQRDDRHFLLPHDAQTWAIESREGNAFSVNFIEEKTSTPGVERVLIVDACRRSLERSKGGIKTEGGLTEKGISNAIKHTIPASPVAIFCSCEDGNPSSEFKKIGGSLFTRALLHVFNEKIQTGQKISLPEICKPVCGRIKNLVDEHCPGFNLQIPCFRGSINEHEIVIRSSDKPAKTITPASAIRAWSPNERTDQMIEQAWEPEQQMREDVPPSSKLDTFKMMPIDGSGQRHRKEPPKTKDRKKTESLFEKIDLTSFIKQFEEGFPSE